MKKKKKAKTQMTAAALAELFDQLAEEQSQVVDTLRQLQKIICDLRKDLYKVTEQILSLR